VVSRWLDAWLPAGATPAQDADRQNKQHKAILFHSSRENGLQNVYSFSIIFPPKISDLNLLTLSVAFITVIDNDYFYLMPRLLPSATLRTRIGLGFFEM